MMMTGKQRVWRVLEGEVPDRSPLMPIVHTALARMAGVPLGQYFTSAQVMADVIASGAREFGFDGVQLTMGVAGEADALGARIEQPPDGAPLVVSHPLRESISLEQLRQRDPNSGMMAVYHDAVARAVRQVGQERFVLSTLRGPLNMASQLCGVEDVLIDMIDNPEGIERVLDFTTDIAIALSHASLQAGADGIMFGEATCSPNFISPAMYRRLVHPRHVRLVSQVQRMGWRCIGLHVCGNILPILDDLINTGITLLDVDYQVPASQALDHAANRVTLRGNLDPVADLFNAQPDHVQQRTQALLAETTGRRWILSSGCDTPPGTPRENLAAFADTARHIHA